MESREVIKRVHRAVATALADDRVRRHSADAEPATIEEERTIARHAAMEALAGLRPSDPWGGPVPTGVDDRRIVEEAIASILGLGRLEPLLENDDITDIHVRGNAPVWVKLRDGRREQIGRAHV